MKEELRKLLDHIQESRRWLHLAIQLEKDSEKKAELEKAEAMFTNTAHLWQQLETLAGSEHQRNRINARNRTLRGHITETRGCRAPSSCHRARPAA